MTFVAGLFGLIPVMVQIISTIAQRRDRMTRLNQLRAELELLERINTLQGQVSAGDEAAKHRTSLIVSDSLSKLLDDYNKLSEIAPSAVGGGKQPSPQQLSFFRRAFLLYRPHTPSGWIWHTMFYSWGLAGGGGYVASLIVALAQPPYDLGELVKTYILAGIYVGFPLLIIQRLARRNATQNAAQLEEPTA